MNINAVGFDFSKFVPGFDFLKQITQPRSMMPSPAQWVAPTVDPEEVERRIQELRTVQFWLEQNTTALKATIQALEVQKMTLTTLKDMNVGLNDMAQVFQQGVADTVSSVTQAVKAAVPEAPAQESAAVPASAVTWHEVPVQAAQGAASGDEAAAEAGESPLNAAFAHAGQWWGSMMQTFQSIAQQAQEDVLQRQAEFLKAQEEMAQQVAAAMPEVAAGVAAAEPAASSVKPAKPAARATAARKPAAAKPKASAGAAKTAPGKAAKPATAARTAPRAAAAAGTSTAGSPKAAAKPAAARKPAVKRPAAAKAPAEKPRS